MADNEQRRVTLRDVAKLAGVSLPVASLALANKRSKHVGYSAATRERVVEAAKLLGYRRNRIAASFREQKNGCIGVLFGRFDRPEQRAFPGILRAAAARDLLVVVEQLDEDTLPPKVVREECVDGLIVFKTMSTLLLEEVQRLRLPLVQVNTNQRYGHGAVTFGEEMAAASVVHAFVEAGRRRVAFFGVRASDSHYSLNTRFDALVTACAAAGLPHPLRYDLPNANREQTGHISEWLAAHDDVNAAVLHLDLIAPRVYQAAQSIGLSIPADLSVVGFNDTLIARAMVPRLTTLAVDYQAVGSRAMELLGRMLDGAAPADGLTIPYALQLRESI